MHDLQYTIDTYLCVCVLVCALGTCMVVFSTHEDFLLTSGGFLSTEMSNTQSGAALWKPPSRQLCFCFAIFSIVFTRPHGCSWMFVLVESWTGSSGIWTSSQKCRQDGHVIAEIVQGLDTVRVPSIYARYKHTLIRSKLHMINLHNYHNYTWHSHTWSLYSLIRDFGKFQNKCKWFKT